MKGFEGSLGVFRWFFGRFQKFLRDSWEGSEGF